MWTFIKLHLECDKSSIPAVVRFSPNLYVSWKEHVFALCSSIFNEKNSFIGLKEKIELKSSICDESLALNSSKNLSVAEKLIILYRKKQSEARKLVSKLNAGECRKVHNYLRNLINSRQTFAEGKSNRVMLVKLVNDLVTWRSIGAET